MIVCFPRGRWSDDLTSDPNLSSPEQSDQELEDREEEAGNEEEEQGNMDNEDHLYQTVEGREKNLVPEPVYALPPKQPKVRF